MGIFSKQFIDVIEWTEPQDGILALRYPMEDLEIQNGARLTVRDSQVAVFVNEGRVADVFAPGLYTLNTQTLPVLTYLNNWDKAFQSPFKSDVYFFSQRLQTGQRWGTATPISIRDKEFGAVRVRGFGIYSYKIADAKTVYQKLSGTRDAYLVSDLEGQLRHMIVGCIADTLAQSSVPFLDMAANQIELSRRVAERLQPSFGELGLTLNSFVVESLSLPAELQKTLDERIGMNMVGDMGRYTQFQTARSIPLAAANEGGGAASAGVSLGAGLGMAQSLLNATTAIKPEGGRNGENPTTGAPAATVSGVLAEPDTKFCINCGKPIPKRAAFCPACGGGQS
jgi:membrane protease subunit (stomatin/prohibitin family)